MKPEGKLNKNMIKRIIYHDLMINFSKLRYKADKSKNLQYRYKSKIIRNEREI